MSMRGGQSARPAQFELMISFMERHGDILCRPITGMSSQARLENLQKWIELTDLLNDKSLGEPKPIDKWRKCWSDFKNNTKKKLRKINRKEGKADLTDLERRLLILMGENKGNKRKAAESDDDDPIIFKAEIEPDQCDRTSSPHPRLFCDADGEATRRKSSASSDASTSSFTEPTPLKRKKRFKNNMKDMTDRYIEFERERERMAHEREMARIKQNDQLVTIFGRIVNVLETIAPSIQRYLDRSNNDDG